MAMERLYDSDRVVQIGRLPDDEDATLEHQTDSAEQITYLDRRDREIAEDLRRFGRPTVSTLSWKETLEEVIRLTGKSCVVNLEWTYHPSRPEHLRSPEKYGFRTHCSVQQIVTAVYIPTSHLGQVTAEFRNSVAVRDDFSEESLDQAIESSALFWKNLSARVTRLDDFEPSLESTRPVFDRQPLFRFHDQEYIRWVPFLPFLPTRHNLLFVFLHECVLPRPMMFFETVNVADRSTETLRDRSAESDNPLFHPDVCVVTDGGYELVV